MKPLLVLLACLVLMAAFNLTLDATQWARVRSLAPALAQIRPPARSGQAFDSRLENVADPAELRKIAHGEHTRRQDNDQLLTALLGDVDRMNGTALWRGGVLLVLALGALVAALRAERNVRASQPRS